MEISKRGLVSWNIRDFKIQRRGRQRERQKTIGLISKTTTSHVHHTFLYISFPFLHDYDVKMPNFAFYGGRKQATTKFYFSCWAWIWSLKIQLQEGLPTFDKVSGYRNNHYKDLKNANSLFKRRSCRLRVVGSQSPYKWVGTDLNKNLETT